MPANGNMRTPSTSPVCTAGPTPMLRLQIRLNQHGVSRCPPPPAPRQSVELAVPQQLVEATPDFAATLPRTTLTAELRVPNTHVSVGGRCGGTAAVVASPVVAIAVRYRMRCTGQFMISWLW